MGRKKKAPDIRLPKIEQLPSGAWHTRVLVDGRRVSITKDNYEECVAEYLGIKNKVVEAQEKKSGKSITLEEAENAYIAAREGFASPSTIRGYNKFKRNMFQGMMRQKLFSLPLTISGKRQSGGNTAVGCPPSTSKTPGPLLPPPLKRPVPSARR